MRREALAEEEEAGKAAGAEDTEMSDAQYGESISEVRRASSSSAAAQSSASAPPSSTSSSSTLKRTSLANIVHDMDVTPVNTSHEVIEVASDSEDDSDSEEEDGEPQEGEEPGEAEVEAEPEDDEEDDEDSEDSEEEDDDEGSEDETDVPTATQAPVRPTPPAKISINDLTTTDIVPSSATIPVTAETAGQASAVPVTDASAPGTETVAGSAAPASKKAKPVSKRKRTPSPSPPPAPPPPPITTIRLEIKLGGPSNYQVDIIQMAKDTGQRPASPPPLHAVHPVETEAEPEEQTDGKKKKRKKKNAAQEYYDTNDPFIDDSELAIDQRTHVAQTKQEGFYVSSGEVALLKDMSSPKKPKSTKKGLSATLHSTVSQAVSAAALKREASNAVDRNGSPTEDNAKRALGLNNGLKGVGITNGQNQAVVDANGKKDGPSAGGWTSNVAEDEGEEKTGQKRKRYITVVEGGKKRKIVNINSFHPELQAAIEDLKKEIAKESWEQKGKFPPALKPHVSALALLAIKVDEYDDHFFNLLPILFPYNKFTMTKLTKRTVYPEHVALLQERQDELLKELEDLAKAGFTKAEEEWQRSVTLWDKRQEKARLDAENAGPSVDGPNGINGSISAAPSRHPTEEKDGMDVDQPTPSISAPPGTQGANNPNAHPPAKKFRLTEQMKAIIWDLVLLSNECCRLENEKNGYENSVIQVSEQGLRKVLYQKIVAAFPDGWMSSGQISRDVSAMKKRLEKEALENE